MINSSLNLCKTEWLDLVFAKRNKEYGAYYLRQHSSENINKAMGITFIGVTAIIFTVGILIREKPKPVFKIIEVDNHVYVQKPPPAKKEEVKQEKPSAPQQPTKMTQFVTPVPTEKPVTTEPPKVNAIEGPVGPETIDIPGDDGTKPTVDSGNGKGSGAGPSLGDDDKTVYNSSTIEVNPEPVGGAAAWAKFLQKNLRYPPMAVENNISGKVYATFIVEKDGHLSSFEIIRGVGYGTEEESMRVLKLAPAWKPGIQNGRKVRVKYTLPLNFLLNN